MLGALGDIGGLFKQAKEMQQKVKTLQEELAKQTFDADAGAGAVAIRVNGRGDVLSVSIRPDAVNPQDVESLEELVKAAANAAHAKSREAAQAEMSKITAGMNLPGLGGMLGLKPPG
ncbi:MAG: YbaB/EbfC family nucleoid-associated protein [Phycisphaerae bacterium]